jgi:hypothetical protein
VTSGLRDFEAGGEERSEPTDSSGGPSCPFCDSAEIELVSLFGSQLLVSQHRCRTCRSYFEALREDREDELPRRAPADRPAP